MSAIAAPMGVPVVPWPFPDALSALVVALAPDSFAIGVNRLHHRNRRRFSVAHELGHAIGIRHVDDSAGIMHAVAGGQPMGALTPTEADMAALRKACRRF